MGDRLRIWAPADGVDENLTDFKKGCHNCMHSVIHRPNKGDSKWEKCRAKEIKNADGSVSVKSLCGGGFTEFKRVGCEKCGKTVFWVEKSLKVFRDNGIISKICSRCSHKNWFRLE